MRPELSTDDRTPYRPPILVRVLIWFAVYLLGLLALFVIGEVHSLAESNDVPAETSYSTNGIQYVPWLTMALVFVFPQGLSYFGYVLYPVHFIASLAARRKRTFYFLILALVVIVALNVVSCSTQPPFSP